LEEVGDLLGSLLGDRAEEEAVALFVLEGSLLMLVLLLVVVVELIFVFELLLGVERFVLGLVVFMVEGVFVLVLVFCISSKFRKLRLDELLLLLLLCELVDCVCGFGPSECERVLCVDGSPTFRVSPTFNLVLSQNNWIHFSRSLSSNACR
jgi:hypothetical protein